MDHLEGFLCPEAALAPHTPFSLSLSLSLRCHSGGQRESEQKSLLQRVKESLNNQCSNEVTEGVRQAQAGRQSHPQGRSLSALWQWGLQAGLGEGEGGCADPDMGGGGCQHRPAPHPQVDAWWVGLGMRLARRTQAKGWKEPTKAGTYLVLSTKNDAQLGS